jgi:RNA polymerase sigma-70 factor (ECF subfamily)
MSGVDAGVQAIVAAGVDAFPELSSDAEGFAAHVQALLAEHGGRAEALRPDELYLAWRCGVGDAGAVRILVDRYGPGLAMSLGQPRAEGVDANDLTQSLLMRLVTRGDDRPPRIFAYRGAGSLATWLRVAAHRLEIDTARKRAARPEALGAGDELADAAEDPELDLLKRHYRAEFREAFEAALAGLQPRQRNLLRLSVVQGRSATAIAELYGVHRATAKRWLAAIREELFVATRGELMARLDVQQTDVRSIVALIRSRFDVSVQRLLGPDPD